MTVYVFDMDGTLTPPRLPMTEDFAAKFIKWQKSNICYIASGSDFDKINEQLPLDIVNAFTGLYCSMGNVLIANGQVVYQNDFAVDEALIESLKHFRETTKYPYQLFDNYIELRTGMINFSVLGRNCTHNDRLKYAQWDCETKERLTIQHFLSERFPCYDIAVGGSISMDITLKGHGKGQIAHHLRSTYPDQRIVFFGDKTMVGGNDYELALALSQIENTQTIQVNDPNEVLRYLGA